jgi:hypothetical protein
MPFTFSHPALVLPLFASGKKFFSLSGLVMGSIAPDFEYFIRMKKGLSLYSHTPAGLLYFNLPLSLVLLFVFHEIVRNPLIDHMPQWLFKRFYAYHSFQWRPYFEKHWIGVVVSVLAGAITHLAWDRLTHTNANYVHAHRQVFSEYWQPYFVIYGVVHALHSLAGIAVLVAAIRKLPIESNFEARSFIAPYWVMLFAGATLITLLRFFLNPQLQTGDLIVSYIAAFLLVLLFISFFMNRKGKIRRGHSNGGALPTEN